MPTIQLLTKIKAPREIVFDLSRSIDLHIDLSQETKEKAISGKNSGLISLNESVTWRAKHFGVYQTLTSKITAFKYPEYFVDEMQKGIFKSFKHEHIFEEKDDEFTLMIDVFHYQSPLAFIGKLADSLFLKNYMKHFLEKRNLVIKEYAETEQWKLILKA